MTRTSGRWRALDPCASVDDAQRSVDDEAVVVARRPRSWRLKRLVDVVGALTGLTVLALPMLVIAALIRWRMGPPVLFVQHRPGRHGELFGLLKFRTMTTAPADEPTAHDAARVTPLGRTLRSTSLDELPELLNVLRGDMSLVGPRPLLAEYLPRYSPAQMRRHDVRPGVTGLAQAAGRKSLSWEETFALDVFYVDHGSMRLDLAILWCTASRLLGRARTTGTEDFGREDFRGGASNGPSAAAPS